MRHSASLLCLCTLAVLLLVSTATVASNSETTSNNNDNLHAERGVASLEDGTSIQFQLFHGVGPLRALKYIFTNTHVAVTCPGRKDFSVFSGRTMPDVREAYAKKDKAWCGWDHFVGTTPDTCRTPVSPRGSTYVAVVKPKTWLSGGGLTSNNNNSLQCEMEYVEEFSMNRFVAAVMGMFLFWSASALSESAPFRLTGGALGITLTSVLLISFILSRHIPQKRSMLIGTTLFSGSLAAAARFAFGTWLPSTHQLLTNPLVLSYLVLSALTGLAITYYYDDTTNQKLNTILKVALQLVGLTTLGLSSTLSEVSVVMVSSALLGKLIDTIMKATPATRHRAVRAQRTATAVVEEARQHGVSTVTAAANNIVDALKHQLSPTTLTGREDEDGRGVTRVVTAEPAYTTTTNLSYRQQQQRQQQHPHVEVAPIPTWLAEGVARTPTAGGVTPTTTTQQQQPAVSPLIERGMILNEETGRLISIGKPTYNKLVEKGYEVDMASGTITPPPVSGRKSVGGGGGGRGSGRKR